MLLTLLAIAFIAMANLRGVKESGRLFAIPTYGFITCMLLLLVLGFTRWILGRPGAPGARRGPGAGRRPATLPAWRDWPCSGCSCAPIPPGCTALTGVEAISNGVTAFKDPPAKNAARTMVWMVVLLGTMFLGITLLSHHFGVTYHHSADPALVQETLLSKLGRAILSQDGALGVPGRLCYYLIQGFTFAILVVAANTAYADFPRLAALQAKDGFLPQQFTSMGDRLVFSNGILILSAVSGSPGLPVPRQYRHAAAPVRPGRVPGLHHQPDRHGGPLVRQARPAWQAKAVVNGVGAAASAIVMLDIAITKFVGGAWIVIALVPVLVMTFFNIHRHYIRVKSTLAASRTDAFLPSKHHAMVLVSSLHAGVVQALAYARLISGHRVEALTVDLGSDGYHESPAIQKLRADWAYYGMGVPLRSVPSPYRRIVEPILEEVDRFKLAEPEVCLTVILPEFVTPKWWQRILHNQMAFRIKAAAHAQAGSDRHLRAHAPAGLSWEPVYANIRVPTHRPVRRCQFAGANWHRREGC